MKGLKLIAFMTGRKNSSGVKEKNSRPIAGKPCPIWALEAALETDGLIDEVWIFHDDPEVLAQARTYKGVWSTKIDTIEMSCGPRGVDALAVIRDRLLAMEEKPAFMVVLTPSSPLVTAEDIKAVVVKAVFAKTRDIADCCGSVCEAWQGPEKMVTLDDNEQMHWCMGEPNKVMLERQEYPKAYALNGCCSAMPPEHYMQDPAPPDAYSGHRRVAHVMPTERSIHIDTDYDWALAELFLNQRLDVKYSWFDGVHPGRRAFVCGNGPSLSAITPDQWQKIDQDITFGVNGVNQIHDVKYLLMTDIHQIFNVPEYIDMRDSVIRSKATFKLCLKSHLKHANPYINPVAWTKAAKPSERFRDGLWLSQNSVHACLNLALIMGCNPIVLLGLDYGEAVHGHPHPGDRPGKQWDMAQACVVGFSKFIPLAKKLGVTIINGLPSSKLPYYDKKPLAEILADG